MGNSILCRFPAAKTPWYLEPVGVHIYTIEELCYVICHDFALMDEKVLDEDLADWLGEELGLTGLAARLRNMKDTVTPDEYAMQILRTVHYLDFQEMQSMGAKLRSVFEMPSFRRFKAQGDVLFSHGRYFQSIQMYRSALDAEDETKDDNFCGSIYYNLGCVYARLFQMEEAVNCFEKANSILHSGGSLKSVLYAIWMKDGHDAFVKRADELGVDPATRAEMIREMESVSPDPSPVDLDRSLERWIAEYHKNAGM